MKAEPRRIKTAARDSGTASANRRWLRRLVRQRRVTLRTGYDAAELHSICQELPNLFESLTKLVSRIRHDLLFDGVAKPVILGACHGRPALRAGNNIVRLGVPRRLELVAAALRALDVDGAHKILDKLKLPNEKS